MSKEKIIRKTEEFADAVSEMNKVREMPMATSVELKAQITEAQKKDPSVKYLEPSIRIPTGGKRHPEAEKQREYMWEYVKGVYENMMVGGEGISFYLTGLPGDDYCRWDVPANKPVALPRFVAQHLSKGLQWREFKPLERNQEPHAYQENDMMKPFENMIIKKRGTFQPLSAY